MKSILSVCVVLGKNITSSVLNHFQPHKSEWSSTLIGIKGVVARREKHHVKVQIIGMHSYMKLCAIVVSCLAQLHKIPTCPALPQVLRHQFWHPEYNGNFSVRARH